MPTLTLLQALDLFVLDKQASGYSRHTLRNYRNTINKVRLYFNADILLASLTRENWVAFFAWLQDDYVSSPAGVAPRGEIQLSQKTICNVHTDLSAFYTWAVKQDYAEIHLLRSIERPRYEKPVIETLTQEEVKRLLRACHGQGQSDGDPSRARSTALRDCALILTLLSTGARVSEICAANMADFDAIERSIKVAGKGKGRDHKERLVYLGNRATRALMRYLTARGDNRPTDPLFCVMPENTRRAFTRDVLGRLLRRIGERAGVHHVHAHRFRHTFAVNYIRNGGDVLTLQALLGHESLEMVRHYARVAAQDCARVHRNADPVDNWRL
jgi:integrase/recombinase XerD